MVFEHFAINVQDPRAIKDWYCSHLGLQVVFEKEKPHHMMFLADSSGRVVCELYHRPEHEMTDFKNQHPLTFHFAFVSENAATDKDRLLHAGATFVEEVNAEDGSHLVMLRDPWGLSLQLCQRTKKLV